jgi:hypothetical protein
VKRKINDEKEGGRKGRKRLLQKGDAIGREGRSREKMKDFTNLRLGENK